MNLRPLSLIAGLLLLAACSQNPSTNANTGGSNKLFLPKLPTN